MASRSTRKNGVLKLEVDAPDVLHVTYSPLDASPEARPSDHVVIKQDWPAAIVRRLLKRQGDYA